MVHTPDNLRESLCFSCSLADLGFVSIDKNRCRKTQAPKHPATLVIACPFLDWAAARVVRKNHPV